MMKRVTMTAMLTVCWMEAAPADDLAWLDAYNVKEQQWFDRAKLVANYYWKRRDPKTNLLPERPNAGRGRFDGGSFVTANTGLYCHSLLTAYEMTKEKSFRDQAVAYLKAYAQLGYDEKTGKFWGAIKMDGTPIPGPRVKGGYAQYEPRGHLDLWEPYGRATSIPSTPHRHMFTRTN